MQLNHAAPRALLFFVLLLCFSVSAHADDLAGVSGTDVFDLSNGTVVVAHDTIIAPENVFSISNGFENGHTLMRNGGPGSMSFINFDTAEFETVSGVRLFAKNDQAGCCQRRSLSGFRLLADVDSDGVYETVVVETAIDISYQNQLGNESTEVGELVLSLRSTTAVTAKHWRLEAEQGSDLQPFEGARIVEVDAFECIDEDGDGWGWDGELTCKMPQQTITACIDEDGDGFGWNGVSSCTPQPTIMERIVTAASAQEAQHSWGCFGSEYEFYSDSTGVVVGQQTEIPFVFSVDELKQQLQITTVGGDTGVMTVQHVDGETLELNIDDEVESCIFGAAGSVVKLINDISNVAEQGEAETIWQCVSGEKLLFGDLGNGLYSNRHGDFNFSWNVREYIDLRLSDFIGNAELSRVEVTSENGVSLFSAVDEKGRAYHCQKEIRGGKLEAPWDGGETLFLPTAVGENIVLSPLPISNIGNEPLDFNVLTSDARLFVSPRNGVLQPGELIEIEVVVDCHSAGSGGTVQVVAGKDTATFGITYTCFDG